MKKRWPELMPTILGSDKILAWVGPLRGFQMNYKVQVQWNWRLQDSFPHVFILEPGLRPRLGTRFIDIPHLLFNSQNPRDSALCLFDPDNQEWNSTMWISETTVPWASEWLHHYELWHVDGVWRGPNAPGPISIGARELDPEKELKVAQE